MSQATARIKVVILDLDGVIYRGNTPLPGAHQTTTWLRQHHYQTYFFTNNSTRSRDSYVELLASFGISADQGQIVTSASLTCQYFRDLGLLGRRQPRPTVLVVGEGGLASELRQAGLRVVRRPGARPIDYVVVGMDRRFTYRKLYHAQQVVRAGAKLIATNRDATYPVENGNVIPGGGSIVAAVATAAEQEPVLIGKPSARAGELILSQAGATPDQALMVGDRLETDIQMGRRASMWTCLVLTGISRESDLEELPPPLRPHWVIPDIGHLPAVLGRSLVRRSLGEGGLPPAPKEPGTP
jgi:phosphoglycolate/pyridoxal phosphate phosphatase family enzyme